MRTTDFESLVTPDFIRGLFSGSVIDARNRGWCITVCGKIVTINGKMIYKSREQAVKAFYNSFNWRATRDLGVRNTSPGEEYHWWSSPHRAGYWKAFKKVLERDYGFKIIRI